MKEIQSALKEGKPIKVEFSAAKPKPKPKRKAPSPKKSKKRKKKPQGQKKTLFDYFPKK